MHSDQNPLSTTVARQRGSTLIVVLVLILLATLMALFAVKVNLSEQRASGNDVRARLMRQSAEAALSQGAEYLKSLKTTEKNPFATAATWTQCTASDTSFPCGTVPVNDGLTPAHVRRANMFYYTGSTVDIDGNGTVDAMEKRMFPMTDNGRITELTTSGNGFNVQYGVGALLCVLKKQASGVAYPPGPPVECATVATDGSGTSAVTLVGVGSIPGESAHTTLTQSVGSFLRVNNPIGAPPIVASGSADLTGTFQLVTNPNAAGTGVPISIWTRGPVNKTGTSNTCYYDEFIRNGQGGPAAADLEPPLGSSVTPSDQIMRCDQCTCQGSDSLSFSKSGNKGQLGIDILQCSAGPGKCDGNTLNDPTNPATSNYEIKPNEFPCDLFQYVFSTAGHKDADGDNFCEKQITVSAKVADGTFTLPADEAYLYAAADKIIPTAANTAHVQATQLGTCAQLNSSSASGLWWDQTGGCTLTGSSCLEVGVGAKGNNSSCVGSITFPVLVVGDAKVEIKNATVFGFMFVRSTGSANLDPTTGGNGHYTMNAKSTLYGALVVQGTVDKVNGSAAIIYNDKVLKNLVNNSLPPSWASVPGGWSDRFSY
ncbi:MAG: PilX N-terminal domain-containing pilus assembly protein [Dokdonella sp.]